MAALSIDTPHLVHTGAACTACCNVAPGKLLRCGACDSAWYCNQECQRADFKQHRPLCRAMRLLHALQADLPPESWPRTPRDFYVQRINVQQLLGPMLRRPLTRAELRGILGEAKCSVCLRTRGQLVAIAAGKAGPSQAPASGPGAGPAGPSQAPATGAGAPTAAITPSPEGGKPDPTTDPATTADSGSGKPNPAAGSSSTGDSGGAAKAAGGTTTAAAAAAGGGGGYREANAAEAAEGLSCCPQCQWGWACTAHRGPYWAGAHVGVCLSYRHMNESQLLAHRNLTATGRVPNYVPDTPRWAPLGPGGAPAPGKGGPGAVGPWEPPPEGWPAYQAWRPLPPMDPPMLGLLSKRMSQALTAVQALLHHYSPAALAAKRRIDIHVLGASAFEVPADLIWEEILNLIPPLDPAAAEAAGGGGGGGPRVLHVAFVGPELSDIILDESDGRAMPQGSALSPPAPPPGRELLYSYHLCTYQDFVAGRKGVGGGLQAAPGTPCPWSPPDLAIAFNAGASEADQPLWGPALAALVRHHVPLAFTAYAKQEAEGDAAAWVAAGGEVTLPPQRNPFRATEPIAEPSMVDVFYYQSNYWWCGRAAGGAEAKAA
ncbi:hypothetical protein HYH03_012562 [Edaphochlamys debaryana]|uniref:MYND-type domain-containing protein n=1 Tax=Edaphochlamys debaryana TaxID=47281 RepID=A0A835XRK3_9CHLO|nr:hypothetical protein HYH03_012562 [Edaphochlamys debaryana]|eukprot:KAG2488943.1 hypothetical protein HYH03_012562 [Edaphochlamys debaryana]